MGFSINTNLDALNTYTNLTKVQNSLSSSLAKLSSGLRINNAGDDAAGMTIATTLNAQVSGLQQASRNAQDGTSVVQTADGALTQVQSLLGNLRDLAVQAANDSNSASARAAITTQATAITQEIGRLGKSVNFNGQNLLDGSITNMKFQVGANGDAQSQITVDLSGANLTSIAGALGTASNGTVVAAANVGAFAAALATSTGVDFTSTVAASGGVPASTTTATASGLKDGNNALLTTNSSLSDVVTALNSNATFSAGFTAVAQYNSSGTATGIGIVAKNGGAATAFDHASSSTQYGTAAQPVGTLDFTSAASAQTAINTIQSQLDKISTARASIGAAENRFTSAESTISTSITNLTAAASRITDVDMASEMVNYSRANILSQSGTAMLAQANSLPQLALKLLG